METEEWSKYYAECVRVHKKDGKDIFQLTNCAIDYCAKKMGVGQKKENSISAAIQ